MVTVELGAAGNTVWTHPGGFASYHEARRDRFARFEELRRRWDEEHAKLKALVLRYKIKAEYNDGHGLAVQGRPDPAAQVRGGRAAAAEQPREQQVTMRLKGGRTGKRAVVCEELELTGLMKPFDLEVWYGERVAVLGSNGSGKSHFLRLLAAGGSDPDVEHRPVGEVAGRAGATTPARPSSARGCGRAGSCRPTSTPSWSAARCWRSCTAATSTATGCRASRPRGCWTATSSRTPRSSGSSRCPAASRRGSRSCCSSCPAPRCCCSTSPPTTSTCESAEALEEGLEAFEGTVLAVTHDRWFARGFDRFLVYGADGSVYESDGPVWDEGRVAAGPLSPGPVRTASSAGRRGGCGCAGIRGGRASASRCRRPATGAGEQQRAAARRRRRCRVGVPLRGDGQLDPGGERMRCHARRRSRRPARVIPAFAGRRASGPRSYAASVCRDR